MKNVALISRWRSPPSAEPVPRPRLPLPLPLRRHGPRLLLALLAGGTCGAAQAHASLCRADEVPVFACSVGRKMASLCATRDLSESAGALNYRFGTPGHVELAYPDRPGLPRQHFSLGTIGFSGGGGDFIRFRRGAFAYALYSVAGSGGEEEAGVTVHKDGQLIANLPCRDAALDPAENWARVYKAGLPRDEAPFELPPPAPRR